LSKLSDEIGRRHDTKDLPKAEPESIDYTIDGDKLTMRVLAHREKTEDEVIEEAGLDARLWRVKGVRKWTTTMKLQNFTPIQVWNYHYSFERTAPVFVQEAVLAICKDWKPAKLPKVTHKAGKELLVVSPYDVHFGKLCWSGETGEDDYDLNIARDRFVAAAVSLADERLAPERILIPVGNDFFHIDNWRGETTKGTQMDFDSRYPKVYRVGFEAFESVIRIFRDIAPVELMYVPGNHDKHTSWHLCNHLGERFASDRHVTVDCKPTKYKQYTYGKTQFWFAHGESPRNPKDIALQASVECDNWSTCRFREIHLGHLHKRQLFKMTETEVNGTMIRYMPGLTGSDYYHYENGWTGNHPAMDALTYDREDGFNGFKTERVSR